MAEYFLCLDAETFLHRIRQVLADSWRLKSFNPCRPLCKELLTSVNSYAQRYRLGDIDTLIAKVAEGIVFDRAYWRFLVGEVLLFAAAEIPEFPTNAEALSCLLDPASDHQQRPHREQFAPIQQALRGSRDVTFGTAVYRPDQAGYNDPDDVARLAGYLNSVQPQRWKADDLKPLCDLGDDEERADELAFVREWFPSLVELYHRAHIEKWVLIIENIY